ncbi:MAG: hypothetical protein ACI4J8_08830 [Oscillospiraceae bacterium]
MKSLKSMKGEKGFLRNAVILTLATALVAFVIDEWGIAQVIVISLMILLTAGQWALFVYMKKTK